MRLFFLLLFILFLLLGIRFATFYQTTKEIANGTHVVFEATLLREPTVRDRSQSLAVTLPNHQRVTVITTPKEVYGYGERLLIAGTVTRTIYEGRDQYRMLFPNIKREKEAFGLTFFGSLRTRLITLFRASLAPEYAAVLLGVVFGIRLPMPQSFFQALQEAGVLHVIAASGMNVTIVAGVLSACARYFFRRQVALAVSILGILFYLMLSGFEPSILRATLMGVFLFIAQILGRQTLAWYGLLLSGFFMLLFDPVLISDVGFQLSFAATCGLLFLSPMLMAGFQKTPFGVFAIHSELVTTIAAQLSTLPILLGTFGSYSPLSILANALVLWTIPILMILGGVASIIGLILPEAGKLLLLTAVPLLWYFKQVILLLSSFHTALSVSGLPVLFSLGYYLLLLAIVLWERNRHAKN